MPPDANFCGFDGTPLEMMRVSGVQGGATAKDGFDAVMSEGDAFFEKHGYKQAIQRLAVKCTKCDGEISPKDEFCGFCGTPLEAARTRAFDALMSEGDAFVARAYGTSWGNHMGNDSRALRMYQKVVELDLNNSKARESLGDARTQAEEEEDVERKRKTEAESAVFKKHISQMLPPPPPPHARERENAARISFGEYMNRLQSWMEYEEDMKEQKAMAETHHRTLTRFYYTLKGFSGGFTENASDVRAMKHNRLVNCARELQQAGILIYTPTPDGLPEAERIAAKRIISKHI
jgi:hypothetical protein